MATSVNRKRIGIIIYPSDPFWIQTLEAVLHQNQQIGDELQIIELAPTSEYSNTYNLDELSERLSSFALDALICTSMPYKLIQVLVESGLPLIFLSETQFKHPLVCSSVGLYGAAVLAGRYIAKQLNGKGHVVCVTGGLEDAEDTGQGRLAGLLYAFEAFPQITVDHIPAYWDYDRTFTVVQQALRDYPQPIDAIFGASDWVALATRDAGHKLGVLQDNTRIVGINGDPLALVAISEGTMTATVETPAEAFGARALKLAHQAALGLPLPPSHPHELELITRDNVTSKAMSKLIAIADIPTRMVGYNRQQEINRLTQMETSAAILRQFGTLTNRTEMIDKITDLLRSSYEFEYVRLWLWSKEEQVLISEPSRAYPRAEKLSLAEAGQLAEAFQENKQIFIPDIQISHRYLQDPLWPELRSRMTLPVHLGENVIGVLDMHSFQVVRNVWLEPVGLQVLADQVGIAVQNSNLYVDALRAAEVAERANQLKTRLLANVGHEMRTPMNIILGYSQSVLKKTIASKDPSLAVINQDVRNIYQSGEHLLRIINDLIDLSRAEIGALDLYIETIDPSVFLQETFQSYANSEESAEVVWQLDLPERLPLLQADTVRLRQILLNLLSNARKFTRQGKITLGARVEPPYLHLWISDTGEGIPSAVQEKIFEPFVTGNSKRRRPEGMGLGLSVTRHLVSLHGGTITLESQPERGSTFHVYLPLPNVSGEPMPCVDPNAQPVLLFLSTSRTAPQEVLNICERQKLELYYIQANDPLPEILTKVRPVALAWDLSNSSPADWMLINQLNCIRDFPNLPLILFGHFSHNETTSGLTNVIVKPFMGKSLMDVIAGMCPPTPSGPTILVVDDDALARDSYEELIRSIFPQSNVLQAENGARALELIAQDKNLPDLVLLDLMMPEVDGFSVLEQLAANETTQKVPVVVISGKILTYEDVQRLNRARVSLQTKNILSSAELKELVTQVLECNNCLPLSTSVLVKQVVAYMHQNYAQPLARKQLADAVGVSENYLSQIFRQEVSISPWEYLNRLRILKARELLVKSDASVTVIASQVGFNDSAYFSRVFSKITGLSPQAYRNRGS